MTLAASDLPHLAYFVAIARHNSFRRAALEFGVTTSALSHAMSALEARRGVRLLNRTTRSVTLTAAGEEFFAMIEGPLQAIGQANDHLNRYRDAPAGRVRISVPEDSVSLLLAPVMQEFVVRYPEVEIDLSVSNRLIDVVGSGFDAGIRYGGTVPEDMIAQRLSPDFRWLAAASPAYLATAGKAETPDDLQHHRCIGIRLGNDQIYRWEFERGTESIAIATPGPITLDESHAAIAFALSGVGILYGAQPVLQPYFDKGALVPVLADWASEGSGFHIYYPSRRHVPAGLRLLVDLIREMQPMGALG